ncbi:hypothetical protein K8B83_13595 [Shewanella inventionis]|uniref:hypothetical protein n=1 Tax=Shewanella inventionis TaxID=1738770 RepID=UPI001CBBF2F2|nr:hypothetical protein [Shewanella inventionis]UAL41920.1 hypothetical protein K8B83_13595 [Shewanella inventionis]
MELIFEHIQKQPEFYAWCFVIVNGLWGAFLYFNKKRHQEELEEIKQSLNLDLERRKKVFEMKTSQYEAYFKSIDEMHNRHQTDYQEIVVPILNRFNASYQRACEQNDSQAATEATILLSNEISKITYDGFKELQVIRSETNALRLTASDTVAALLDELQELYEQLFQISSKMVSDLVKVTIENDQALAAENQNKMNVLGELTKSKFNELREQMRNDLKQI